MAPLHQMAFLVACAAGLAVAAAAADAPPAKTRTLDARYRPSSEDVARFEFLRRLKRERDGYITEEGDRNEEHLRRAPAGYPSWEEQEKSRAAVFDKRFGAGAYDGMIRFYDECRSAEKCDYLPIADVLQAAFRLIALDRDLDKGVVVRDSPAHRTRDEALRTEMRKAIEGRRPKKGAAKEYARSFAAFSEPILKKLSQERRP